MADPVTLAVVGGLALSAGGTMVSAYGQAQQQKFESAQAKAAAAAGRVAADQTDTVLSQELTGTLASIASIRASSGISADSPTTAVIAKEETSIQNRTRRIERGNRLRQAKMDDDSAKFLNRAAKVTLLGGALKSAGIAASGYGDYRMRAA